MILQIKAPFKHVGWREWKQRRQMGWPYIFVHVMSAFVPDTLPSPTPPFSDLCHDCGFSFIVWACAGEKKKEKGTSAHSRSVPRCSMRSVLEPASQIHDCMTAAPLKIRHVSCDGWLLLDKLSAGILFILLGTQPQRVKKAKLSMLSTFCCESMFISSEHRDARRDSY